MTKKLAVVIGRFTIPHNGHFHLIEEALRISDHVLIVLGSSFTAPSIKNPFTGPQRAAFIKAHFHDRLDRLYFAYIPDYPYSDDLWASEVQAAVAHQTRSGDYRVQIALVGHTKDESSFYLRMFPQWVFTEVPGYKQDGVKLSSTMLREQLFRKGLDEFWDFAKGKTSEAFLTYFEEFWKNEKTLLGYMLMHEQEHIDYYKRQWKDSPYPPTFVTVDTVVVQSGHVLLIERKAAPGQGLWALPGGFLNQNETLLDGAIRELREETKIDAPAKVLKGSVKDSKVFDHPGRSLRGRTITHAFHIELPIGPLPKVKGNDDASGAFWIELNDVLNYRERMFEDHYDIISHFVGRSS